MDGEPRATLNTTLTNLAEDAGESSVKDRPAANINNHMASCLHSFVHGATTATLSRLCIKQTNLSKLLRGGVLYADKLKHRNDFDGGNGCILHCHWHDNEFA